LEYFATFNVHCQFLGMTAAFPDILCYLVESPGTERHCGLTSNISL